MRLAITLPLFLIVFGFQGIASYKLEVELVEEPERYEEGHLHTGGQGRYPRIRARG